MGSLGKDNIYDHGRSDLSQIDITPSVFHAGDFNGDLDVDILEGITNTRTSIRGILLTPEHRVLLIRMQEPESMLMNKDETCL